MLEYIRVAGAVPGVCVGNVSENLNRIREKRDAALAQGADVVIFPELALTGYTCADLFFQTALLQEAVSALATLTRESAGSGTILCVGAPLNIRGLLYNCAAIIADGHILGVVPKTYIPNYNEFYEKRWFASACDLRDDALDSAYFGLPAGEKIPVGRGLLFDLGGQARMFCEICEDLWSPLPPSTLAALNGAELIVNLSASNETIAKRSYRRDLVNQQSARLFCAYAYVSAGASESTTDLVYSGHSLFTENGKVLCESAEGISDGYLLTTDFDLGRIRAERARITSYRDCISLCAGYTPTREIFCRGGAFASDGSLHPVEKQPFVPSTRQDRLARCRAIFDMQVAGLVKRLTVTGCRPVLGVSGGLDSTLALLVCREAVSRMVKPASDVVGITMPCFGTSDRTYRNSLSLMQALGVTAEEIPVRDAVGQHFADIGQNAEQHDLTYENAQARERTQVLMDYAGRVGGLVVGTGDLSELALGWCTYNADHMSMYGVNGSIPKTLVRWMIDTLADSEGFRPAAGILRDILDTPISPELLPPDATGRIAQQTEDIVGPYALHDFFLFYVLRFGFAPEKIYALACRAFAGDFDAATVKKWLKSFYRRFFTQQFKRSCLPDGVKVGSICLSPRGDWRMPSDASAALWLARSEQL